MTNPSSHSPSVLMSTFQFQSGSISRARPVEGNVLARVRRPLPFVAEGVDGADRRLPPRHPLCARPGLAAGCIHELWIRARQTRRPCQSLGPRLDLSGDLDSPMSAVGRDLERDLRPLDTAELPPFGEERRDLRRKSAGASLENQGKRLRLSRVCALFDEEAGRPFDLPRPQVALPSADANVTETIEVDVAVVAATDVPEEDRFAVAIVRCLGEGARARDGAAAVVEPVSSDVPRWDLRHARHLSSADG